MSNWIDYNLDVLASSPDEMNRLAERLNRPSQELTSWVAQRFEQPLAEVAEGLKRLLEFKAVKNLGYLNNSVNKARRFRIAFNDKRYGIVWSHLLEASRAFPAAIFLLEYCDEGVSYAGKQVIRAGEVVHELHDGDRQVQGLDWALLDIFAPFRTEYYGETAEFGSLWLRWLEAVIAAARRLKGDQTLASQGSTEAAGQNG
jgi:hypothetical protein